MSPRRWSLFFGLAGLVSAVACGFSPTAPFEGFDGQGSRVRGSFDSSAGAQSGVSAAAAAQFAAQGLSVSVKERSTLSTTVGSNGSFTLVGVPSGSISLVFQRDRRTVGEVNLRDVRRNQEITLVLSLGDDDDVVLLDEQRDAVSFEDECPRGAGFWCQNQGGKNPNLSAEEFQEFAAAAATLLASVETLNSAEEIAAAVCNNGDQLLRQLATLALNLASETVTLETALVDQPYATVGEAFDAAVALASSGGGTKSERNAVKDVLEAINDGESQEACEADDDDDDDDGDDDGDDVPNTGKVTICHIPPGNPSKQKTLSIGASAWPAHQAHGDYLGACR